MLRAAAVVTLTCASAPLASAFTGAARRGGGFLGRSPMLPSQPARAEGRKVSTSAPRMDLFTELFSAIKTGDPELIPPDQALPDEHLEGIPSTTARDDDDRHHPHHRPSAEDAWY